MKKFAIEFTLSSEKQAEIRRLHEREDAETVAARTALTPRRYRLIPDPTNDWPGMILMVECVNVLGEKIWDRERRFDMNLELALMPVFEKLLYRGDFTVSRVNDGAVFDLGVL